MQFAVTICRVGVCASVLVRVLHLNMGSTLTKCMKQQKEKIKLNLDESELRQRRLTDSGCVGNGLSEPECTATNGVVNNSEHQASTPTTPVLKRSGSVKYRSNISLRRIGSFRNFVKGNKKHNGVSNGDLTKNADSDEEEDVEGKEEIKKIFLNKDVYGCQFIEMYRRLCANSFQYESILEHPIFIEYSPERRKSLQVSICSKCININSICAQKVINNVLLHELSQSFKQKRAIKSECVQSIAFYLNGLNQSDILSTNVFEEFSKTFGENLLEVRLMTSFEEIRNVVGVNFSSDITGIKLCLCSHFRKIINFLFFFCLY